ncbi:MULTISPECIES: twin-arginine translocase subunit TatC [unclassified Oceanobacillus]|uniref:twin-arginine translocase subunit TatC n=1 Tax=unclassified Oceanobacillus TaxID=2630292 RepID=UPI00300DFD60
MSSSVGDSKKEMNVVEHLSELRNRLIVTAIFFVIFFVVGFANVKKVYTFFINDTGIELTVISPGEIIWIYFTLAGLIAIIGTIPILAYQVWAFISPGLTSKEKRVSVAYIPGLFILFIIGLIFGYIIFLELIFPFLLSLNDGMFNVMFTVERYFGFLLRITVPFAFLFELPIIVMFLTSLGILSPRFLTKNRKYSYFVLIVIGVLVTPPEFMTQIIVAIPLIILYEVSIILSKVVSRKKEKLNTENI